MPKLGLIHVRGAGDCIVLLPIAKWYYNAGYDVYLAIDEKLAESFQQAAPYCTFVPIPSSAFVPERGILNEYWFELPHAKLTELGCDPIIFFPQHESLLMDRQNISPEVREVFLRRRLSGPYERHVWETKAYRHLKADEYKYCVAKVPLKEKWNLDIRRNPERELALYNELVDPTKKQLVCHLHGSNFKVDPKGIAYDPNTTQLITITPKTDNMFDWLLILEKADTLVMLDSAFFHLVEQLNFTNTKYFVRRSTRESNPVFGNYWNFLHIDIPDVNLLY